MTLQSHLNIQDSSENILLEIEKVFLLSSIKLGQKQRVLHKNHRERNHEIESYILCSYECKKHSLLFEIQTAQSNCEKQELK